MKRLFIILILISGGFISCDRFELDFEDQVIARNFYVYMDENPSINALIGTIDASSSFGRINYRVDSMAPEGAFRVHDKEGHVRVHNPALFDYEKDSVITGKVTAFNKDNEKTINVRIRLVDLEE